ncbi:MULTISPECIES: hypothetical protein [unclassified Pedobacter]|uniref:hypothetical protein n=1 Tax=unclassified Pedobacter TaxID=2628915 RepID=UPI00141E9E43|nr:MULTISPECIES: hypothetical protein [unclassified Pedobacter]NII81766.1 hypothetical protein [Pedobacter sp. SG908]NMN35768.1 hypothetical protein [Pedobacter sp. SG918]
MENLSVKEAEALISYFKENVISQEFNDDDTILNAIIKNDADFDKALKGLEISWYDFGEYPEPFTGVVTTEDGSKSGSFEYKPGSRYYFDQFSLN